RAHGVRGELRVVLHNPASEALARADVVWVGDARHAVAAARPVQGGWLVRLAAVDDRDVAEGLRGRPVAVARAALGLAAGEYLLVDLVGCRVVLADGTPWGEVVGVEVGPQDRLVIRDGGRERLLPAVAAFLVEVDVEGGRIVVDPPEG